MSVELDNVRAEPFDFPIRALSAEENETLVHVGPGTPMGDLMRRYWIPVCLADELGRPDGPPVRVKVLGEDLVAFRDSNGKVGLVDAFCAHRRAPLFYGRNEDCGLRCVYHGWKYDASGQCVDLPSEPPESKMRLRMRITAYETWEGGGLVWAYLGPPEERPSVPDYEWTRVPGEHLYISKSYQRSNYLQAIEGGIDTAHISFLHNNNLSNKGQLALLDRHPRLEVERTSYGFRYAGIRRLGEDLSYARVYQFIVPFQKTQAAYLQLFGRQSIPLEGASPEDLNALLAADCPHTYGHVWVPMDDHTTAVYNFIHPRDTGGRIDPEYWEHWEKIAGRGPEDFETGSFWLKRSGGNDYLIDREIQRQQSYTGIEGINTQDMAIQEGMGPIVDRSKEHLGTTDRAVVAARLLLLEGVRDVQEGRRSADPAGSSARDVRGADQVIRRDDAWQTALADEMRARW